MKTLREMINIVEAAQQPVAEGVWDSVKSFAKDVTRDSTQKMIKRAWDVTYWPKYIEPALNNLKVNGRPFNRLVLGAPKVIENDRSEGALLKQYTVDLVFPIDPADWRQGDMLQDLNQGLQQIEKQTWNQHDLAVFDSPMISYKYSKTDNQDLIIPVRLSSLDSNISNEDQIDEASPEAMAKINKLFQK